MKRRILAAILAAVLCFTMIPFFSFGDSETAETKTMSDGSSWTVDGNNYTCNSRISWPNFSAYKIGENAPGETVTISSLMRVGKQADEATNAGGDSGFLFGVTDVNGDGKIAEGDDLYYLVEFSGYDGDHVNVVISRNNKSWKPVRSARYLCPSYAELTLTATYDSATATINAYVNGELVTSYTDGDPFTGTGYYLASKITNGTFKNVETAIGKTPDWVGENDGETVVLDEEIYDSIVVPAGKTITVDLNGHYVFAPIVNYGTLTLKDSKGDGFIEVRRGYDSNTNEGTRISAIDNYGSLTIDGATVLGVTTGANALGIGVTNRKGATISVKSGEIRAISEKDNTCYGVYNAGTISEISGGRIVCEMIYRVNNCDNAAIWNDGGTITAITGGEIYSRSNARGSNFTAGIYSFNSGKIGEISGGYIHAESFGNGQVTPFGLSLVENSTIDRISGGIIEGYALATNFAFGVRTNNSTIGEISGGLLRSYMDVGAGGNSIALATFGSGGVDSVTGGVFWADGVNSGRFAVRCNDSSKLASITGGAFKGDQYLLNAGAANGVASGYALSDAQASGYKYVTNGAVSEETTADGIVGTTNGKSYTLYAASEKASAGGTVYDSVSAAIEAAGDGSTVKLLGNSSTAISVPAGKNIVIDLNGTTQRGKLTNNGTLKLVDSKTGGRFLGSSDASGEFVVIDNFGTLIFDGANVRAHGRGGSTDADAIKNESGAHLTVLSGRIQSTIKSTYFGNAIKNYGTIDLISGGELISEVTIPYDTSSALNNVTINQQGESARIVLISGGNIWARNNNTGGNGNFSTAIRNNNASQVIEKITGGTLRAYALKNGGNQRVAFGILNENGTIGEIAGGFIAGYTSGVDFCFGIKNQAKINKISGGYILAEKDTLEGGGNMIALANWGTVDDISGGTLYARVGYNGANSYAIRTNNSGKYANISGGTFGCSRNFGEVLLTADGGKNNLPEGYYISGADTRGFCVLKNSFDSKNVIYALGSSVTFGSATYGNSFAEMIDGMLDDTTVIKNAVSGTTLVNNDGGSYVARLQSGFNNGYKTPDLLLVQLSTNDASQNKTLGTLDPEQWSDFNDQTIIGAIEFIINYAKTTWDCEVMFYTNPKYESDAYKAMVDAMPAIAEKWDISVIDFYNMGTPPVGYMSDSIHPSRIGYRWMAEVFAEYLDSALAPDPEIISGDTVEYEKESGEDIVIVTNVDPERIGAVEIDGEALDADDYTVTAGDNGTVITISSTAFDVLTLGDHTVTIVTRAGDLNATVTVTEAAQTTETGTDETETGTDETETGTGETEVTETGDATVFIIILAVIVSLSIAVITLGKRKVTE